MQKASFWQPMPNKKVKCGLCSHNCQINDNDSGICKVRINKNGELYSPCYGFPFALNVDPVEKKPLFHFLPGSYTYSLGAYGCNFACANCQNWRESQVDNVLKILEDLTFFTPERIVENAIGENCDSIAYTYTEPTVFTEYALEIMKKAHLEGLRNIWVSNGYMSKDCLEAIIPFLDAVNVDLKSMSDDFYKNNCQARLGPVLENLKYLKQEQVHLEISTLVIPALSDDINMFENIADFIVTELDSDTPWHISRFSPEISWNLQNLPTTSDEVIYEAYECGRNAGLKYVYVGNIPGDQKENTYCPKCGELVIRRLGYHIERFDANGHCPQCERSLDLIIDN